MASYTLPIASNNMLGGVKIGDGLDITQDGVLSISEYNEMRKGINELATTVKSGKSLISAAITNKGVYTSTEDSFVVMANNIEEIVTDKIMAGKQISIMTKKGRVGIAGIPKWKEETL